MSIGLTIFPLGSNTSLLPKIENLFFPFSILFSKLVFWDTAHILIFEI